jgi:hypothetical protein
MAGLDASTAITINGVQCWDEGVRENYTRRTGSIAEQTIVCAWGDRFRLVDYFLAGAEVFGGVVIGRPMIGYAPFPVLVADEVEVIEGIPGQSGMSMDSTGTVAYKYARLVVRYRSDALASTNSNLSIINVDFGKQIYTPSKDAMKFEDGKPLPIAKPISVPIVHFTQVRRNLSSVPIATIIAVSQAPLNSVPIFGGAEGTILFDGARSTFRILPGQTINYGGVGSPVPTSGAKGQADLEFAFSFNPRGWDMALDTDGTWKKIKLRDDSEVIPKSDLNALFT